MDGRKAAEARTRQPALTYRLALNQSRNEIYYDTMGQSVRYCSARQHKQRKTSCTTSECTQQRAIKTTESSVLLETHTHIINQAINESTPPTRLFSEVLGGRLASNWRSLDDLGNQLEVQFTCLELITDTDSLRVRAFCEGSGVHVESMRQASPAYTCVRTTRAAMHVTPI